MWQEAPRAGEPVTHTPHRRGGGEGVHRDMDRKGQRSQEEGGARTNVGRIQDDATDPPKPHPQHSTQSQEAGGGVK